MMPEYFLAHSPKEGPRFFWRFSADLAGARRGADLALGLRAVTVGMRGTSRMKGRSQARPRAARAAVAITGAVVEAGAPAQISRALAP